MKPKRIALLDLSALARAALGALESDEGADGREPTPAPVHWTQCGTELADESHCAQLDAPAPHAFDDDDLAIELALDWIRAKRDRARRTPFERTLLRTLQARLRRGGRSVRRGATRALGRRRPA